AAADITHARVDGEVAVRVGDRTRAAPLGRAEVDAVADVAGAVHDRHAVVDLDLGNIGRQGAEAQRAGQAADAVQRQGVGRFHVDPARLVVRQIDVGRI